MSHYLNVTNLTKTFETEDGDSLLALDHISFGIECGEFACVLGPSGCGKTTILRTIAGLEQASGGQVVIDERRVTKPGPEIGVVFQEHRLFPWLNVEDNVAYGLARQGANKAERHRISGEYLDLVGLSGFEKRLPKELSIGMSQRVGIARALASDPAVLLMDEPFASVDAQTRRELQRELLRIWQETGKTILFVTHSVDEAILLGQRVIVLSPRPSYIREIIPVDLDYPRRETDPDFNTIKQHVLDLLYNAEVDLNN